MFVLLVFGVFIIWNGGIVLGTCSVSSHPDAVGDSWYLLGDKSNHTPVLHIPQLYYFVASATFFGWPVLLDGFQGAQKLINDVWDRMFSDKMFVSQSSRDA